MTYTLRVYLYLCVVTLIVASLTSCEQSERQRAARKRARDEPARKEEIAKAKSARQEIISALMKNHGGSDVWDKGLNTVTWTADLEEQLVGQTIISAALLVDVWLGKDNKYDLYLVKESTPGPRLEFFLSCQKPDKLPQNVTSLPEYVFAAKVLSVRKDRRFAADILNTGFFIDAPLFTVRGECVELKRNENRLINELQEEISTKAAERLRGLAK